MTTYNRLNQEKSKEFALVKPEIKPKKTCQPKPKEDRDKYISAYSITESKAGGIIENLRAVVRSTGVMDRSSGKL
ncbi:unnamed protein product [Dracunculus medinensis]|uniref:Transposase n=1 Tax=Dracunculus medinensis TaxID=318479 RepID=A0A0N4UJ93_DRAME|nr:unnamed protein product [Dracunculus medinensis]